MTTSGSTLVSEVTPQAAWEILSDDSAARLVDVRTRPEWGFVGGPDVSALGHSVIQIEWASYPDMSRNPAFCQTLEEELDGKAPSNLLFLCRSGVRSLSAAQAFAEAQVALGWSVACINIVEGFEGDLDAKGRRGHLNGWKMRGLAWRQT